MYKKFKLGHFIKKLLDFVNKEVDASLNYYFMNIFGFWTCE